MLTNRNILCISTPQWSSNYASTIVQLMTSLGRHNRVLYVQNPYTVKDLIAAIIRRQKFPFKKVLGLSPRLTKHYHEGPGEIHVLIPPLTLSINFLPPGLFFHLLMRFNGWIVRRSVSKCIKVLNLQDDLINIVSFNPLYGVVNGGRFQEKVLIYHCYDEIEQANWMKKHGPIYEKKMMRKADAVVVTSQGLFEKKKPLSKACFLVKNAANIQLFETAFTRQVHTQKTVGYIGSLDNRIDVALLFFLAESLPSIRFVFIGRVVDKKIEEQLCTLKNVVFLGSKPLTELPSYVQEFSAGIIPFVQNEFTRGIYPLKINEYLAAGTPVVSTNFGVLDDFSELISIAQNQDEFRQLLVWEMENDTEDKKIKRQMAVKENNWENRAELLSEFIQTLEKAKCN